MNYGDVFYWNTDQVLGRDERNKYHIYVCPSDHLYGETFLVLNKAVNNADFPITRDDIPKLTYNPSYLSCSSPIEYSIAELSEVINEKPTATLTLERLRQLRSHIDLCRTMERIHKRRILSALQGLK